MALKEGCLRIVVANFLYPLLYPTDSNHGIENGQGIRAIFRPAHAVVFCRLKVTSLLLLSIGLLELGCFN